MSRELTASDRKALIRLASTMPVGAPERKAILNGLSKTAATRPFVEIAPGQDDDDILSSLTLDGEAGVDFEATLVLEGRELAKVLGVQERVLARRLDQMEKKRDPLISERDLDAIFDMKRKSIHMGASKAMAALLDYGTDFDLDLYGPQDNPYLSIERIKPNAVRVTFEIGSVTKSRPKRTAFSDKTAARNDKRLAAALLKYLDEIRNDWQKMFDGDKNYARGGKYDPVADVGVAVGPNAKRYTNANADVVLHYDGAGYDIFSEQGDLGIEKYRRDVEKLGQKYGYHAEPLTNWSLGFYYEG